MGKKIRTGKQPHRKKSKTSSSAKEEPKKHKKKSLWKDHALEDDLAAMGLRAKSMESDGNCFFRALGDQLYGDEERHMSIREQVLQFLVDTREMFEVFIADDETFEHYISRMREVDICIYQAGDQGLQCLCNKNPESKKTIHISYHDGEHYNSVRNADDYEENVPPTAVTIDKSGAHVSGDIPNSKNWTWRDERHIMNNTGCSNEGIIHKFLKEHDGAIDLATEAVIEWSLQNEKREDSDIPAGATESKDIFEELFPGWSVQSEDSPKSDSEKTGGVEYERDVSATHTERRAQQSDDTKDIQTHPSNKKLCPCGSRKKYKACCKARDSAIARKVQKTSESQDDTGKKLIISYI